MIKPSVEDSIKKRYTVKLLASIVAGLVNVVIFAILPKALGPVVFGQYVYLQDFFSKLITLLSLQTPLAFFTKLSADNNRQGLIGFYFIFSTVLLITAWFIFVILIEFGYKEIVFPGVNEAYIQLGLWFGFLAWASQVFIKISDAYALTVLTEIIKASHKVVIFLLLIALTYFNYLDLTHYFYLQYIAYISLMLILSFVFIQRGIFSKNIWQPLFDYQSIAKEFYRFCSPLFLYGLLSLSIGIFDIWLLQNISGSKQTGFYGIAYGISAISVLFSSAMIPILIREFARYYANNDIKTMAIIFRRYVPMLYALVAYFSMFVVIYADNIVYLFAGNEFLGAGLVVSIMAFYPLHQTYIQLSNSVLYATEQTKLIRNIGLFSMSIGLILSIVLIYWLKLGALGLVIKMLIFQMISATIQLYYNTKLLKLPMLYFIRHQILMPILFLCIAFGSSYLVVFDRFLFNFLAIGFVYTLISFALLYYKPSLILISQAERDQLILQVFNKTKQMLQRAK